MATTDSSNIADDGRDRAFVTLRVVALVILRAKAGQTGAIRLKVDSPNLKGVSITLQSVAAKP